MLTLVRVVLLISWLVPASTHAQQLYPTQLTTADCKSRHPENAGYLCNSDNSSILCRTALYYRVQDQGNYLSLSSIANLLFSKNTSEIASASGLSSSNVSVSNGQGLFIPIDCTCYGNFTSFNVSYTIEAGDTFYKLANTTYEGLTTCQAIQDENPKAVPTNLQLGQVVTLPLRCACPSQDQRRQGVQWLYTYPITDGDTASSIVTTFNLSQGLFLNANGLNSTSALFPATTVLLPFVEQPLVAPNASVGSPTSSSTPSYLSTSSGGTSKTGIYVGLGIGLLMLVLLIGVFLFLRRIKNKKAQDAKIPTDPLPSAPDAASTKKHKMQQNLYEDMSKLAGADKLVTYTLEDLKQETDNFSPSTLIRGSVYRGVIKGKLVAVKKMTRNVSKELQILQKVHHSSLITLLGVCSASSEQSYLVYEYAENGSLSDWLHGNESDTDYGGSSSVLTWNNRLQVALDVATALEYIHEHTTPSFVHKDVKSSNILLDAKYRGKLANFGLAKSAEQAGDMLQAQGTRHIEGTQGYIAPEYFRLGIVSPKMDIFAFGVVLLEILSGEEAILSRTVGNGRFLHEVIGPQLNVPNAKEKLKEWMDPHLQNDYPLDCAYSVAILAKSCVAEDPSARPDSRDVAYNLAKLLEISLEWEPSGMTENYTDNPLEAR